MNNNRSWCRTDLTNVSEVSALDIVYLGLGAGGSENIALYNLKNSSTCEAFVQSLQSGGFDGLDLTVQENTLSLMIKYTDLFKPYKLDDFLISFLQKEREKEKGEGKGLNGGGGGGAEVGGGEGVAGGGGVSGGGGEGRGELGGGGGLRIGGAVARAVGADARTAGLAGGGREGGSIGRGGGSLVFQLAQQVLQNWVLFQSSYTFDEKRAAILLDILQAPNTIQAKCPDPNDKEKEKKDFTDKEIDGIMRALSQNTSEISEGASSSKKPKKRPRPEDFRIDDSHNMGHNMGHNMAHNIAGVSPKGKGIKDTNIVRKNAKGEKGDKGDKEALKEAKKQLKSSKKNGNNNDDDLQDWLSRREYHFGSAVSFEWVANSTDLKGKDIGTERVLSDANMEVIKSSLKEVSWLDAWLDEESGTFEGSAALGEGVDVDGEGDTDNGHPDIGQRSSSSSSSSNPIDVDEDDDIEAAVSGLLGASTPEYRAAAVPMAVTHSQQTNNDTSNNSSSSSSSSSGSNKERHLLLLTACRAHRASVLKAGSGNLLPKTVQQLAQSAYALLIRIGVVQFIPTVANEGPESPVNAELPYSQSHYQSLSTSSNPPTHSSHPPPLSQSHSQSSPVRSQSLSQHDDSAEEPQKNPVVPIMTLLFQAHAIVALSLHRAPDEVIAAVSGLLLPQINAQSQQSQWQGEGIQPVTAVIFLTGVLLMRIRSLTEPASRLFLRAVEVGVKNTPTLLTNCMLTLAVRPTTYLDKLISEPQQELVQRVARQLFNAEQCDELVYRVLNPLPLGPSGPHGGHSGGHSGPQFGTHLGSHLGPNSGVGALRGQLGGVGGVESTILLQCAAIVFDALLSPIFTAKEEKGKKSLATSKAGIISALARNKELTNQAQDEIFENWTNLTCDYVGTVYLNHSRNAAAYAKPSIQVFAKHYRVEWDFYHYDPEVMKTFNTVLTMMPQISERTLRELLTRLTDQSHRLSLPQQGHPLGYVNHLNQSLQSSMAAMHKDEKTARDAKKELSAIMHTVATRFAKMLTQTALKEEALHVLSWSAPTVVGTAAIAALKKLP